MEGSSSKILNILKIKMTLKNFQKWLKLKHARAELFVLVVLILIASFFRFWQIRDYVVFLGDEGRDMIVMRQIFTNGKLPFLGPTASVGGFYLGPIYYWMAAPFLGLFGYDPVGPSVFVATVGVLTVLLLFKFLKEASGIWPAAIISILYAISPLIVRYSRSSWNPNPLPFFSLLLIYFLYLGIIKNKLIYFLLAGASFGIAIQLHYLASILLPIVFIIVLINTNFRRWIIILLVALLGSLVTFSPFLLFELRHNFPNSRTILEFISRGTNFKFQPLRVWDNLLTIGNILLEQLSGLRGSMITKLFFWILTLGGVFSLVRFYRDKDKRLLFSIALIWFFGGFLGLRSYSGQIYDYYFGFMFPAPFLLAGIILGAWWQSRIFRTLGIFISTIILILFLQNGFYKSPPNRLIDQTEHVADLVIEKSDGKPFNFALISPHNSDHAYRYFLDIKGYQPTLLETLITDQLLIVCESNPCPSPLGHPLWEIAAFGRGEISQEWELPQYGFKVYRLIHWPGAPNPAGKPAIKGG